ncbi:MAG: GEVED domain-containing protein [Flavobacteriales bacterium]
MIPKLPSLFAHKACVKKAFAILLFSSAGIAGVRAQAILPAYCTHFNASIPLGFSGATGGSATTLDACGGASAMLNSVGQYVQMNFSGTATNVQYYLRSNSASGNRTVLLQESPDGVTWTTIATHTQATVPTTATLYSSPLATTTRYVRLNMTVRASNRFEVDGFMAYNGTPYTCYCGSTSSSGSFEYISSVGGSLNTITSGRSNYANYISFGAIGNIAAGATSTITVGVNGGYSSDNVYIFADWNRDGDFLDAGELCGTSAGAAATHNVTITAPAGALSGNTVMRVKLMDGTNNTPCQASYSYGEVEDYYISVTAGCTVTVTGTTPGSRCGTGTVQLAATSNTPGATFNLYTAASGGTAVATGLSSPFNSPSVSTTTTYYVAASNGSCESNTRMAVVAAVNAAPTLNSVTPSGNQTLCTGAAQPLTVSGSHTDILYSENFNTILTDPVQSVTLQDFGSSANGFWYVETSPSTYISYGSVNSGSGAFAATDVNYDLYGYTNSALAMTNSISTSGYTSLSLTFRHYYYYSNYEAPDMAIVEVNTDGNINGTWTAVQTYTSTQGSATAFAAATVDLSAYVNQPALRVRFRYLSGWNYGWNIDDIVITGSAATSYSWSATPSSGAGLPAGAGTSSAGNASINATPTAAGTYTYTATVTSSNGCTVQGNTGTITVNPGPVDGSLSASALTLCAGQSVTVTPSGGTGTPYYWISSNGGVTWDIVAQQAPNGPGNTYVFTPSAGGTYLIHARWNTSCGFCWDLPGGMVNCTLNPTVTVSQPVASNTLSVDNSAGTCIVNQNGYVHFMDVSGRLIASVNSNGQNLGSVTARSYVSGSPITIQACGTTQPEDASAAAGRHWTITPDIQPSSPVNVRLYLDQGEYSLLLASANSNTNPADDVSSLGDVDLTKYSGVNENNTFTDNCGGSISLHMNAGSGVTSAVMGGFDPNGRYVDFVIPSFSEFWLSGTGNNSPLPVTLSTFDGECTPAGVKLSWTTASEFNSDHFEIQRSADASAWESLGEVTAAGNSNSLLNYSFTDARPLNGFGYYRLIQRDYDLTETVYGNVSVACSAAESPEVSVFPNPASDLVTFNMANPESKLLLTAITETGGRTVLSYAGTTPVQSISVPLQQLQPGMYYAHLKLTLPDGSVKETVRPFVRR